jgi:hypothetical protein
VYNNTATGTVARLTAEFALDSTSLNMGVTGTGPFVGTFFGAPAPRSTRTVARLAGVACWLASQSAAAAAATAEQFSSCC